MRDDRIFHGTNDGGGLVTVHDRHLYVHEDELVVSGRRIGKVVDRVPAVNCLLDHEPRVLQQRGGDLAVEEIVIHEQDAQAM